MIYRAGHNAYRLSCDECEREPEDVGFESFREASQWARDHNWYIRRNEDGSFDNFCPDCAREQGLLPPLPDGVEPNPVPEPKTANWVKYGGYDD